MTKTPLYIRNVQGELSLERYTKDQYEALGYQYKSKAEQVSDDIQKLFCKMDVDESVRRAYSNKRSLGMLKHDLINVLRGYGIH